MVSSESMPEMGDFSQFSISKKLLKRLKMRGVQKLFPVQYKTFNQILTGNDIVVLSRTGSGKTLAFALPVIQKLLSNKKDVVARLGPCAMVLAPTRELVVQITSEFSSLCDNLLSVLAVYGGVPIGPQCVSLRKGVDIIVGTPGRVIDLLERNVLSLDHIDHIVLDEVDRMLDMGFQKDIERIMSGRYQCIDGNDKPQTLMFSATLPHWVESVASKYLSKDVLRISLVDEKENQTAVDVKHFALPCPYRERASTLADLIRVHCNHGESRCVVFCEKKKDADELAADSSMGTDCHVFHGDIPQDKRELVLQKFRAGKYRTLLTTNVAARGLDIPEIDLVIQCHPPRDYEDYIHRSGRTGRAGRGGTSIVMYTMNERGLLTAIEKKAGIEFRRIAAPTLSAVVGSWCEGIEKSLLSVKPSTWSAFIPTARSLIQSMTESDSHDTEEHEMIPEDSTMDVWSNDTDARTALRAICCLLARLSGKDGCNTTRSLLSSCQGLTSYRLDITGRPPERKGMAYAVLRRHLPDNITESIKNLTFLKDRTGFVFDLPSEFDDNILQLWPNDSQGNCLTVLQDLPELEPDMSNNSSMQGNYRGGNHQFRGGQRGRGGFRSFRQNNGLSFTGRQSGVKRSYPQSDTPNGAAKRGNFNFGPKRVFT